MSWRYPLIAALVLAVASCGGGAETTTTQAAETSAAPTTLAPTSTTAQPVTTTEAVATTIAATTTAPPTTMPVAGATLDDGRPATFVAITDDYEAVAVSTLTGEIVHVYGQAGTAVEVASAEEMPPNVFVGVWRILDGSVVGISDCCEPAAGNIFYVDVDGVLPDDIYSWEWREYGWSLAPSPTANMFANLGYSMVVADPSVTADTGDGLWIEDAALGFPGGAAAWTRDGSELYWATTQDQSAALATLDLAEGAPVPVAVLPWVGANQSLDGIGSQASGNLVGFLHTRDAEYNVTETSGVVFDLDGQLLANFPVETGSIWGGYDPSGTFLLYVDDSGTVRWQGGGGAGVVADGFVFASW